MKRVGNLISSHARAGYMHIHLYIVQKVVQEVDQVPDFCLWTLLLLLLLLLFVVKLKLSATDSADDFVGLLFTFCQKCPSAVRNQRNVLRDSFFLPQKPLHKLHSHCLRRLGTVNQTLADTRRTINM